MPDNSDYYSAPSESGSADSPDPKSQTQDPESDADSESMEGETALVPKSIFGQKQPEVGDTCTFKVEHIWENEIELSYVASDSETPEPKPKAPSSMDTATDAFDQMSATGKE